MQEQSDTRMKELIEQGDIAAALHLLTTAELWSQKALDDALYEMAWQNTRSKAPPWTDEHLGLATALLDVGANASAPRYQGSETPLHHAAKKCNLDLVTLLLARGAEVNAITKKHETPLFKVLQWPEKTGDHLTVVRVLLDAGADPNIQAYERELSSNRIPSPCDTPVELAIKHRMLDTAKLLVAHGADVNQTGYHRRLAIHIAAELAAGRHNDWVFLEWLLALGADPNRSESYHGTTLTVAARYDRPELIDYLIEAGADVRVGDALLAAVKENRLEIARRLLQHGADPNQVKKGYSSETTPLIEAIGYNRPALVQLLLEYGAQVDLPVKLYKVIVTPLEHACKATFPNSNIIALLLESLAAKEPAKAQQETGRYYAAGLVSSARDPRAREPLASWLERGADPNGCNEYGRTALHYLVEWGRSPDEVRLLLDAGADVKACDSFGYTPLHDSVLGDNPDIIHMLLELGADPATRVGRGIHAGFTALEIARIERKERAIRVLEPVSPDPRPLTPCEPEFRRGGSVKGFSHRHYEEDMAKNAEGRDIYMRKVGKKRRWAERGQPKQYTEPCVCIHRHQLMSEYRGTGISRAEHPLRWRIAMENCLHCGSGDVLVIYAQWGVQPHDGDLVWSYEVKCQQCNYYSSWGYDEG